MSASRTPELILASTSPYRKVLLERLGVPFRAVAPPFDEASLAGAGLAPRALAEALAARLTALTISIARRVGDTEQLYGSVTASDIAEFLKEQGFEVDRRKLILPEPIKALGEHDVPLKLHREVTVPLKVHVVREGAAAE